jgi:hypothetical protein
LTWSPRVGHHSCTTSSDGAAASIFNSYPDIPQKRAHCRLLIAKSLHATSNFCEQVEIPLLPGFS